MEQPFKRVDIFSIFPKNETIFNIGGYTYNIFPKYKTNIQSTVLLSLSSFALFSSPAL